MRNAARRFWRTPLSGKVDSLYAKWRVVFTALVLRRFYRRIGKGTLIHKVQMARNTEFVEVGRYSSIQRGARIEVILHGQEWVPSIHIGNHVNIEQNVHIICHDRIVIGDNVSITGNCAIVDVTHPVSALQQGLKMGDAVDPRRSFVQIGAGTFIGFGTSILPNVRIGSRCVIGAGSVVTRDIPDDSVASGVPARVIGSTANTGTRP